ncbi:uncharacterized protein LOC141614480 [Silene latifolia]|uniref:uncharacterized protein LOC141614480 n=1 Tax=Silene latifolia TaxID=37657 RepID=UPI003D778DD0
MGAQATEIAELQSEIARLTAGLVARQSKEVCLTKSGFSHEEPALPDAENDFHISDEDFLSYFRLPAYAKFLKEILTKRRSFNEVETVAFTGKCSAMLQSRSPPKLKDPWSFSIPFTIGPLGIGNAICDLGASVSVTPYKICKQLNMTKLKCTSMILQMPDISIKWPIGVLENMPVRVGKFFIPVDFVVINMTEDSRIPIILGRPFLHTAGAVINVRYESITFNIGDDTITFSLDKASRPPDLKASCYMINFDAPAVASEPWGKEVDEIEKLIYGHEPHPEMVYSLEVSEDLEAELDALEAEICKNVPSLSCRYPVSCESQINTG